ncbi:hypothetical protein LTR56_002575 [Elasticomyces elasticus]|nr:hypothetical protein LTR22_013477 [Elasticomyces elasticus]KAK3657061.1 hypothetical protein LTR56_002575 [Elasticomyces elasticus]KAK4926710.1 hypothetical protein LTR49_006392 [Elasticomyces elasticus]KAK5762339.1 hypothetical protein LTS12_007498 [Elasticomyces elasticus]
MDSPISPDAGIDTSSSPTEEATSTCGEAAVSAFVYPLAQQAALAFPGHVNDASQVDICHPFPLTNQAGSQVVLAALDCLRPYLPVSLPLYRRLQFGRFFEDTSCIITNLRRDDIRGSPQSSWTEAQNGKDDALSRPWFMAFVDRSCRPETETWVFGTWEAEPDGLAMGDKQNREAERLLRGLVDAVKRLPVLPSMHEAAAAELKNEERVDSVGNSPNEYAAHSDDPNIMLWGAIHERTMHILHRMGVIATQYKASAMPNHTFVFDVAETPTPPPLPKGLIWGEVHPRHFALVRSRTQIPRQDRTMVDLPSLAIYPSKSPSVAPIAWAFVGLDGSLTTLHVEPEWRGRGLAKAVATKLFRECMDGFWEAQIQTKFAHGFVQVGNEASARVCKSLGGRSQWECYWVRIDLGVVEDSPR